MKLNKLCKNLTLIRILFKMVAESLLRVGDAIPVICPTDQNLKTGKSFHGLTTINNNYRIEP